MSSSSRFYGASSNRTGEFIIRPNSAYNRRSLIWVFALLAVLCMSIALRFAWLGYWMILPFAVLDIVAVGLLFYLLVGRWSYVEKILIQDDVVEIQHIQHKKNQNWQFPLHWVRVELKAPAHRWYPHKLLIGSKGEWIEIGQCLTDDERKSLAKALAKSLSEEIYKIDNDPIGSSS